jgi:hypothetical protein
MTLEESYRHVCQGWRAQQERIEAAQRLLESQGWYVISPAMPIAAMARSAWAAPPCTWPPRSAGGCE